MVLLLGCWRFSFFSLFFLVDYCRNCTEVTTSVWACFLPISIYQNSQRSTWLSKVTQKQMAPIRMTALTPLLPVSAVLYAESHSKVKSSSPKSCSISPHSSVLHHFIALLELANNMWLSDLFSSIVFLNKKNYCIIKPHFWVFISCFFSLRAIPLQQPLKFCEWTTFVYQSISFESHKFFLHWIYFVSVFVTSLIWTSWS